MIKIEGLDVSKFKDMDRVSVPLLLTLGYIHNEYPIRINCLYEREGHAGNSYHSKYGFGGACDFVVINTQKYKDQVKSLFNFLETLNCPFGFGVYPEWNTPGYHLDLREYDAKNNVAKLFWINTAKNGYMYFTDKEKFFEKLDMIL